MKNPNAGKGPLAHRKEPSTSPKQSMQLVIRDAALLFLPIWPQPTEELSGQGSCWKNKTKSSHAWKIKLTPVFQAFGDNYWSKELFFYIYYKVPGLTDKLVPAPRPKMAHPLTPLQHTQRKGMLLGSGKANLVPPGQANKQWPPHRFRHMNKKGLFCIFFLLSVLPLGCINQWSAHP